MSATCTPADCNAWHNADVSIHWTIDPAPTASSPGCADATFTTETADTAVTCDATWSAGTPLTATGTVHIKIDISAPTGVGAVPDRPPDLGSWYNHPISFGFSGTDGLSGLASCSAPVYSGPDGAGLTVPGSCSDAAGNVGAGTSPAFGYDATPPTVTGVSASRPPDHNGWYTRPVLFTFGGSDATSGVLSCDTTNYGGPDGRDVKIGGGCRDGAGNSSERATFSIRYDATPPASPAVHVAPGNRRVDLSWTLPNDATAVTVTRSQQGTTAPPKVIYTGTGTSVLDKGVRNNRKYRYIVTDADEAGNTNSKAIAAAPTASSLRPFPGTAVSSPPLLRWRKVRGATYYNIQLYRGRTKVLSTWPRVPFLHVAQSWRFRGHRYKLAPGHYRWYVWPGYGSIRANHYGKLLGRSSFRFIR